MQTLLTCGLLIFAGYSLAFHSHEDEYRCFAFTAIAALFGYWFK